MQYVFGSGLLFVQPDGEAMTPVQVVALRDVTVDLAFNAKALHAGKWPLAVGRGTGKIPCKAEFAQFIAAGFNAVFFGGAEPAIGMTRTAVDEAHTITAGAVSATHAGAFAIDLGVTKAADGLIFTHVAAAPVGLQYACDDAGGYTFNGSINGTGVLLSYTYDDPTSGRRFDIAKNNIGHTPQFSAVLTETFNGNAMTLTLTTCASSKMTMTSKLEDFTIPSFSFSASANDSGLVGVLDVEEGANYPLVPPTPPVSRFIEDFEQEFDPYHLVTGTWVPFSIVSTAYGNTLQGTISSTANDNSAIQRTIPILSASRFAAKFRILSVNTDDAPIASFYYDDDFQFGFNPRREDAFDSLRRAHLYLQGAEYVVSTAALDVDQWYEVLVAIVAGIGNTVCVIRTLPDNTVIYSTPIGVAVPVLPVNALRFTVDDADLLSEAQFDDVSVNYP